VLGFNTDGEGSVAACWCTGRLIGETGDASGVGAVNERDGGIKWDEDGAVEAG
jgi:hypothetical protein